MEGPNPPKSILPRECIRSFSLLRVASRYTSIPVALPPPCTLHHDDDSRRRRQSPSPPPPPHQSAHPVIPIIASTSRPVASTRSYHHHHCRSGRPHCPDHGRHHRLSRSPQVSSLLCRHHHCVGVAHPYYSPVPAHHHHGVHHPSPPSSPETLNATTLPRLLDPALAHLRDVTLLAGQSPGRSIRAHRFVLASCSPVLRASLLSDAHVTVLTLSHADADVLDAVLQYCYGCVDALAQLPEHTLWVTLSTCITYAITPPMPAIERRIIDCISVSNIFYHWAMADKYQLDSVALHCRNLLKSRFSAIIAQPQFLDVPAQRLARVLRIHDLQVDDEFDIFLALEKWLAFDVDARAEQALQLLRLVRLPTMSDLKLLRVCRSPYFGGHNEFYQLLLEALIRRTEVRVVHAPRVRALVQRLRRLRSDKNLDHDNDNASDTTQARIEREAKLDVSLSSTIEDPDHPHSSDRQRTDSNTSAPTHSASASTTHRPDTASPSKYQGGTTVAPTEFKPLGVTDDNLLQVNAGRDEGGGDGGDGEVDYNRKEDRTVLFEGMFPLRWYKSVRFRPRSSSALLFTVVIPKWSSCRRRFISESRSFLNHKWSVWVDPFSSHSQSHSNSLHPHGHAYDESDYISIYLCCESELSKSQAVDARVDFALFVASARDDFGMERKVCVGRTFKSHGQAMGFRRHTKRARLHHADSQLYAKERDELVIGAHLLAAGAGGEAMIDEDEKSACARKTMSAAVHSTTGVGEERSSFRKDEDGDEDEDEDEDEDGNVTRSVG